MELEFDYYLPIEDNDGDTPLLMNDDSIDPKGTFYILRNELVADGHITYLTFREPVMAKPDLNTDYLKMDTSSVFSKKIYNALIKNSIKGLQLVPVLIRDKKNEEHDGFFIANIYQRYFSFDQEKTEFWEIDEDTEAWLDIEKIVLNRNLLSEIPLKDRLVFESKEHPSFTLYHKSIVDIIMSVNPKGINFIPVEEWNN